MPKQHQEKPVSDTAPTNETAPNRTTSPLFYAIYVVVLASGILGFTEGNPVHGTANVTLAVTGTLVAGWYDPKMPWHPTRRSTTLAKILGMFMLFLGALLMISSGSILPIIYILAGLAVLFVAFAE